MKELKFLLVLINSNDGVNKWFEDAKMISHQLEDRVGKRCFI